MVHTWIMEPPERCFRYRYFYASARLWWEWPDLTNTDDAWGSEGLDGRCYFFINSTPAYYDPFFIHVADTGDNITCASTTFWELGACEGQVPLTRYTVDDWADWPGTLPEGVVPTW